MNKHYETLAARQAYELRGERYADYIESHTLELIARGRLPLDAFDWTLGQRIAGNEGK